MIARAGILILTVSLAMAGSWLLGYRQGQQVGAFQLLHQMNESFARDVRNDNESLAREEKNEMDMDRDRICNEIRSYKLSIAKDLDENTEICGWRDMDSPEGSD